MVYDGKVNKKTYIGEHDDPVVGEQVRDGVVLDNSG